MGNLIKEHIWRPRATEAVCGATVRDMFLTYVLQRRRRLFTGIQIIRFAIWRYYIPKFNCIANTNYLSASRPEAKNSSHLLNKSFTADTNALWPFIFFGIFTI